jgi:hypothetical protein
VRVNDGPRRNPAIAALAAAGSQSRVPDLDVYRGQLLQNPRADLRDDLTVEQLAIGHVPGGGVGAVGRWPAGATARSLA